MALAAGAGSSPVLGQAQESTSELHPLERLDAYGGAWREVPALQDELVALGPKIVPELFERLTRSAPAAGQRGRALGVLLRGALERLPREDLLSHLQGLARDPMAGRARIEAARLLERVGTSSDLQLLLRLGEASSPGEAERAELGQVRPEVLDALRVLLDRDEEAVDVLGAILPSVKPGLAGGVVRVLGELGTAKTLDALTRVLRRAPGLAASILLEFGHLGRTLPLPLPESVLEAVREQILAMDESTSALAIAAAQSLDDRQVVPSLIERLEGPHDHVHVAAHRALQELTGRRLPPERDAWKAWYRAELSWFEHEAPERVAELLGRRRQSASSALRDLASHRLFAAQLTERLLPVLERGDPRTAARACGVVAHLGSWRAVRPLVELLDRQDAALREAARQALHRITRLDLPADAAHWRVRLDHLGYT